MARTTNVAVTSQNRCPPGPKALRRTVSVGELVAAAFDVVGPKVSPVASVLGSRAMKRATGGRIRIELSSR